MTIQDELKAVLSKIEFACSPEGLKDMVASGAAAESAACDFIIGHGHELLSALADAERYRWLRDNAPDAPGVTPAAYFYRQNDGLVLIAGDPLDTALDTAMTNNPEG